MSYKSMSDGKGSLAIQSEIIGRLEKKERRKRESAPEGASRFFATTSQMHLSLNLLFLRSWKDRGTEGKPALLTRRATEKEKENTTKKRRQKIRIVKIGRQGRDRLESLGNEVEYREKRQ